MPGEYAGKNTMPRNTIPLMIVAGVFALGTAAHAQPAYRHAVLVPADYPDEGRCTVSVLVSGEAEVEIRADSASLRRVAGPSPVWERFECTGPLPQSSANLRIRAIEGTGRTTLTHDLDSGGVALVRIANPPTSGDQIYTFDLFWRPDRAYQSAEADRAMLDDDSVQACRTAAENRIRNDGYRDVRFGDIVGSVAGANDLITGTASAVTSYGSQTFSFSCRVDPLDSRVIRLDMTRR